MKFNGLLTIIVFTILFVLIMICVKINRNSELFITNMNDPLYDGKEKYDFLRDKNYGRNVLSVYYLDDDMKLTSKNGRTPVDHPYRDKKNTYFGLTSYLNFPNANTQDLKLIQSTNIYNETGVRL